MFVFGWLFVWVALHSWTLWLVEWKLKKWETNFWRKVLLRMFSIQGSHSYSTDLSMMMLPAGQTMGLPTLRNVLVPGQGCVAYLRKNLLVIVLEFLFAFILVLCICICICICIQSLYCTWTWPRLRRIPDPAKLLTIVSSRRNIIISKSPQQTKEYIY